MTRRQENGMFWITFLAILLLILLSIVSCSTKQSVVETVYVHDTVNYHSIDTVIDMKVVHLSDTVREREIHTYNINNVGDTVKEIHYYHEKEKETVKDSTYRYQLERDSLRHALKEAQNKDKVVVQEKKVMPRWGWLLIGAMAGLLLLFFSLFGVAYFLGRKRNSTFSQ